ncbi:unnamed protein product, partial [Symbiodinium necroappetens]
KGSGGVLIGVRSDLADARQIRWHEVEPGRILQVRCFLNLQQMDIVGVYQHALLQTAGQTDHILESRRKLLTKLDHLLSALPARSQILLGGDLNSSVVTENKISGFGLIQKDLSEKEKVDRDHLMRIMQRHRLVLLNTWGKKNTAATYMHAKGASQIDYVCARQAVADGIAKCTGPRTTEMAGWRKTGHKPIIGSIPHRWTPWQQPRRGSSNLNSVTKRRENLKGLQVCEDNVIPCSVRELRSAVQEAGGDAPQKVVMPELAPVEATVKDCWKLRRKMMLVQTMLGAGIFFVFRFFKIRLQYQKAHRELKKALRARKRARTLDLLQQAEQAACNNDVRALFGVVSLLCPNRHSQKIRLRDKDGNLMCGADECKALADYARELFMAPECPRMALLRIPADELRLERWQRAASKLKAEKAAPNGTPPLRNWSQNRELIIPVLHQIAVRSLCRENPVVPPEWTEVQLAWLAKPRKCPSTPANLRTVGLMAGDTKIFMSVLKEAVNEKIMEGLWDVPQFAYRRLSSTIDALLRGSLHCDRVRLLTGQVSTDLTTKLTAGNLPELSGGLMISLDLAKAFDCMPFTVMYTSLREVGVSDELARLVVETHRVVLWLRVSSRRGLFIFAERLGLSGVVNMLVFSLMMFMVNVDKSEAVLLLRGKAACVVPALLYGIIGVGVTASSIRIVESILTRMLRKVLRVYEHGVSNLQELDRVELLPKAGLVEIDRRTSLPNMRMYTWQSMYDWASMERHITEGSTPEATGGKGYMGGNLTLQDEVRTLRTGCHLGGSQHEGGVLQVMAVRKLFTDGVLEEHLHSRRRPAQKQREQEPKYKMKERKNIKELLRGAQTASSTGPKENRPLITKTPAVKHPVDRVSSRASDTSARSDAAEATSALTARLVNPHNLCYMNAGILAIMHALEDLEPPRGFRLLRDTIKQSACGELNLSTHFGLRSIFQGWTLDNRQRDAAEFIGFLLNKVGFVQSSWEARTMYREVHNTVDAGGGMIFLDLPSGDCDLQELVSFLTEANLTYRSGALRRDTSFRTLSLGSQSAGLMTDALEVPMEQEEELRIWAAFKQAAPTAITGDQEEALDKDRASKFHKPEGKGDSRGPENKGADSRGSAGDAGPGHQSRNPQGYGSKGHGQGSNQRSRHQGGWGGNKWHNWKKDEDDDLETLRSLVSQLARLCLRHEDSINMWRAESSYVLFVRTGIPGSLVPSLFAAKTEWQKLREASPEKVKRPMRNMLFSCLLKEMFDRLTLLRSDTSRRESMEKLGWLKGEDFQRLRWDPKLKKNVKDEETSVISYEDVLTVLQSMLTRCNTVEALLRFHPTRPIAEQMQEGTVAFLLQFSLQNDAGLQLYADMAQLCHCGSMVCGIEVKKERSTRSQLANQISRLLNSM